MTGREAFQIWAPAAARWTDWARPVPFVGMDAADAHRLTAPPVVVGNEYITQPSKDTAVIVDLPGGDGIAAGIALARLGIRPVPLYNGTVGQEGAMALADSHVIAATLLWGAAELEGLALPPDAPPAFLLDSNRTHRYRMNPSLFDNSWDIYPQDMPSAEYCLAQGVDKIVIWGERVQKDLRKVLYPFQKKGISILFTDGYAPLKKIVIRGLSGGGV